MKLAPFLVAADGGADRAIAAGHNPNVVIGDLDSLSSDFQTEHPEIELVRIAEQDSTDFEKSLTRIDAPFVLATGFTAGRFDHALAAMSVLARRVGPPTLLVGADDVIFAASTRAILELNNGTRVSLYPLTPVKGTSVGLEWPIDGLTLSPEGKGGTSNRATGRVELAFDEPGVLVILPREALRAALECVISG